MHASVNDVCTNPLLSLFTYITYISAMLLILPNLAVGEGETTTAAAPAAVEATVAVPAASSSDTAAAPEGMYI